MLNWIITKERLPEPMQDVLFVMQNTKGDYLVNAGYLDRKGRWRRVMTCSEINTVIAWAEMPKYEPITN